MKIKILKLIFLVNLLLPLSAFSQSKDSHHTYSLVRDYNNWLKTMHLDRLMQISTLSSKKDSLTGNMVSVLTLVPTSSYQDPETFATAWNHIRKGLQNRSYNIYSALLVKMADFGDLPLNTISVKIITADPEVFSLEIHYDKKLKYDENIILGKGVNKTIDFNFEQALNSPITGYYQLNPAIPDVRIYGNKLEALFKRYRHSKDSAIRITRQIDSKEMLRLKVSNVYGQITEGRYHEIIYLTINLYNEGDKSSKIRYTVDVSCAGGVESPPKLERNYEDAERSFPAQLLDYNNKFQEDFRKIIYGQK